MAKIIFRLLNKEWLKQSLRSSFAKNQFAKIQYADIEFKQLIKLISTWEDKGVSMLTRLRLAGTIFKRG